MGLLVNPYSVAPSFTGLLDTYSGAYLAYSVRRLNKTYTGPLLRVRRTSDNTETDIGYTSDGALDETALKAFVGNSSGFVTKWYDQSGNSRHGVNSTTTRQFRIAYSGTIEKDNGKPVLRSLGASYSNDFTFYSYEPYYNGANKAQATFAVASVGGSGVASIHRVDSNRSLYHADFVGSYKAGYPYQGQMYVGWYDGTNNYVYVGSTPNWSEVYTPFPGYKQTIWQSITTGTSRYIYNNLPDPMLYKIYDTGNLYHDYTIMTPISFWENAQGTIQEIIIYLSDQSSNRASIKTDIATYYNIDTTPRFLDLYPGANRAYSLRKLALNYSGAAINVRRASDDNTAAIYFTASGELDEAAMTTFAQGSDLFVTRLYDQISYNHLEQIQTQYQPRIAINGVVIKQNGKPSMEFSGNKSLYTEYASGLAYFGTLSTFQVVTANTVNTKNAIWGIDNWIPGDVGHCRVLYATGGYSPNDKVFYERLVYDPAVGITVRNATGSSTVVAGQRYLLQTVEGQSIMYAWSNGSDTPIINGADLSDFYATDYTNSRFQLGGDSYANKPFNGYIQEAIFYTSDKYSSRTAIRDNINTYYGIY